MNLPTAWKLTQRVAGVLGALLILLLSFELLRIFVFLYRLRPGYGWTFATVIAAGLISTVAYVFVHWRRFPARLRPPRRIDPAKASHPELKRYARHMIETLKSQMLNPLIPDDLQAWLEEEIDTLEGLLNHHPLNEDLIRIITKTDEEILPALQEPLWTAAEEELRDGTRRVIREVLSGPERPLHRLRMLSLHVGLIDRIVHIGDPVPALRTRGRILWDVGRALLSPPVEQAEQTLVNQLQSGTQSTEGRNPHIGAAAGSGLLTTLSAQISFERCLFPHQWDAREADRSVETRLPEGLKIVQSVLQSQLTQSGTLTPADPAPARTPAQIAPPPDIDRAFQSTLQGTQTPNRHRPRPLPDRASRSSLGTERNGWEDRPTSPMRRRRKRRVKRRRGISRILHTFGQRIKYTLGLGQG